ncbi:Hypothetical protein A7982_11534 [Minicystis rosea]|nr:Hypothetical protein A7982_11534 [Minicystis rosea]
MGGRTLQRRAKAYPGIRQLSVVKALGSQGIARSICPVQLDDAGSDDFGYRSALAPLFERLRVSVGGQCLARSFPTDENGQIACVILEARKVAKQEAEHCDAFCNGLPGHRAVPAKYAGELKAVQADPASKGTNCVCEVEQLSGSATTDCSNVNNPLAACQCEPSASFDGKTVDGWCYVDPFGSPPIGSPEQVGACVQSQRRILRFVGGAAIEGVAFINCSSP